jgi:hypothetical protein
MSDGMIISGITAVVRRQFATGVEIQDSGRIVKEPPEVVSKPHLTPKYGVASF